MKSCHRPTSEFGRIVEFVGIEIGDCLAQPRLRRRTDDVKAKLKLAYAFLSCQPPPISVLLDQDLEPKFVPNITALSCARGETLCVSEN